jgi:predicted RNA-binding Zn ribbon-like protein
MITEVRPADPAWVVAFVNEYGTEPRREAGEQREPYPPPGTLGEHGAPPASGLTEAQLVSLADDLHRVFASPSRSAAADALNGLLKASCPVPRVRIDGAGDGYERSWTVEAMASLPAAPLTAACALALLDVLTGPWRFGLCEASGCADVYVDRSPGGRRRYCSSPCQNRTKVAAFRRRRRRN